MLTLLVGRRSLEAQLGQAKLRNEELEQQWAAQREEHEQLLARFLKGGHESAASSKRLMGQIAALKAAAQADAPLASSP